jgi:tetratricopeptide (TPR) repeat protein
MVTAPLVTVILDRLVLNLGWREQFRLRARFYLGLFASWIPLGLLLSGLGERSVGFGVGASPAEYALTQGRALAVYFGKFIIPSDLTFDYGPVFVPVEFSRLGWFCVPLSLVAFAVLLWRRSAGLGFLLLSALIVLSPTSSVVPVAAQPIAENRAYLPCAFAGLAVFGLGAVLLGSSFPRRFQIFLSFALILTVGSLSHARLALFRNPEALWRDTIAKAPLNPRAVCNLGELQLAAGRLGEAERSFRQALQLNPAFNGFAATNLGVTLARAGRPAEALPFFELEAKLLPNRASVHDNLGNLLTLLGRDSEAQAAFERALALNPRFVSALNNLAGVRFRAGSTTEALALYQQALALEPSDDRLRRNLASVLLAARRPVEAVDILASAIAHPASQPDLALLGAAALLESGRATEALGVLRACLALRPIWPEAKLLLGNAWTALGNFPQALAAYDSALVDRPAWPQAIAAREKAARSKSK